MNRRIFIFASCLIFSLLFVPLFFSQARAQVTATATPTSSSALPDLKFVGATAGQAPTCKPGMYVHLNFTVTNIGSVAAGPFAVDADGNTVLIPGLAAGASYTTGAPGITDIYRTDNVYTFTIDSLAQVAESNEANNKGTGRIAVIPPTCTPPPGSVTSTNTPSPTSGPSLTFTRTPTVTRTPTIGPSLTFTRTPTQTVGASPTVSAGVCSPVTFIIASPFTFDGLGTYCWQASAISTSINSWNTLNVSVNGINYTNVYVPVGSLPAKINGYWYISYNSVVVYAHFEAK